MNDSSTPGDPRWSSEQLDAPPREANDTPFMAAPRGQLRRWQHEDESVAPKHDPRARRVQFTIAPAYAMVKSNPEVESETFRWGHRLHGFGVSAEFDLQLWRFLWLRAAVMYSAHPVEPISERDEDKQEVRILAHEGKVQALNAALLVAYAVDIGRFMPIVEVGLGGLLLRTPATIDQGKLGGSCSESMQCAEGLTCRNEICQPRLAAEFIVGLGLDIALWRNLSWGVNIRYFVKMPQQAPYVFPTHVMLSLRGGVRF